MREGLPEPPSVYTEKAVRDLDFREPSSLEAKLYGCMLQGGLTSKSSGCSYWEERGVYDTNKGRGLKWCHLRSACTRAWGGTWN